jgi:hypothetical protein
MAKRRRRLQTPLPLMLAELAFASWETFVRRALMMAGGTCSPAEYARMITEKAVAAQHTALVLARPRSRRNVRGAVAPWHSRAKANAKRLRRR